MEAVSFIVNSRLRSYPFALSDKELRTIGDGSKLLAKETGSSAPTSGFTGGETSGADIPEVIYEEPDSLSGYINAIFDRTYAPGMWREDYLHKAYEYYQTGRYNDNDWFYIGVMWEWIHVPYYFFSDI